MFVSVTIDVGVWRRDSGNTTDPEWYLCKTDI